MFESVLLLIICLLTSVICDLVVISLAFSFGVYIVFYDLMYHTGGQDEEWGFGQVMPLVLLVVPIISAVDILLGLSFSNRFSEL